MRGGEQVTAVLSSSAVITSDDLVGEDSNLPLPLAQVHSQVVDCGGFHPGEFPHLRYWYLGK